MSLELPTVSIIVSAYQNISYLPAAIDSILQQTYDNFEILVFSGDYHQIYPWFERQPDCRLRFILQSNLGLATTLNQGIVEARGKYISIVKPGDLWHPSKLQKQVFCLDRYNHIDLVHSPSILIARQGQFRKTIKQPVAIWEKSEILARNQLALSSVMLRRRCFEIVGLFDPELEIIPDWEMWIRLSHYCQFMAIAEPLIYCRQLQSDKQDRWLMLETDLQTMIEKVYALLSPEQQKHRSYGYASLFLARHVLEHKNPDPAIAENYWYQALQHDPLIVFSSEFSRLQWIIFSLYFFDSDRYQNLLQLVRSTGDSLKVAVHRLRGYSQKIVDWMLEEEDSINFWKNRKVKRQGKD